VSGTSTPSNSDGYKNDVSASIGHTRVPVMSDVIQAQGNGAHPGAQAKQPIATLSQGHIGMQAPPPRWPRSLWKGTGAME
jgi:hypothetical protein